MEALAAAISPPLRMHARVGLSRTHLRLNPARLLARFWTPALWRRSAARTGEGGRLSERGAPS